MILSLWSKALLCLIILVMILIIRHWLYKEGLELSMHFFCPYYKNSWIQIMQKSEHWSKIMKMIWKNQPMVKALNRLLCDESWSNYKKKVSKKHQNVKENRLKWCLANLTFWCLLTRKKKKGFQMNHLITFRTLI